MSAAALGAVRTEQRPRQWYRDPLSCLQTTLATILLDAGADPVEVLGLDWDFLYKPGDVRSEEFYFPCRDDGDLAASVAPSGGMRSHWWNPAGDDPLQDVASRIAAGELPIAAVDNYHLPFRPAYHDVHAAHLLVVFGVDRGRGEVHVSDVMPPAFCGAIAEDDFLRSWSSSNPRDVQDAFFSDSRIERRCLSVSVDRPPPLEPRRLAAAMRANVEGFAGGDGWEGLPGLRRFLADLYARAGARDERALEELYAFGWATQASAYLHGELLRTRGADWGVPELAEAGRTAESVACAWTGLRITGAHGRSDPVGAAADLRRHGERLRRRYEEAIDTAITALEVL